MLKCHDFAAYLQMDQKKMNITHTTHTHTHTHTQKADVSNGESGEGVGGVFILSINFSV